MPLCRASNRAASAISVLPVPVGVHHHALLGREPRQQGLLLNLVRLVGELVQVSAGKFVAGGGEALGRNFYNPTLLLL